MLAVAMPFYAQASNFKIIFDFSSPIFGASGSEGGGSEETAENTGTGQVHFGDDNGNVNVLNADGELVETGIQTFTEGPIIDVGVDSGRNFLYYAHSRFLSQADINERGSDSGNWYFGDNDGTYKMQSFEINEDNGDIIVGYNRGWGEEYAAKLSSGGSGDKSPKWTIDLYDGNPVSVAMTESGIKNAAGVFGHVELISEDYFTMRLENYSGHNTSGNSYVNFLSNDNLVVGASDLRLYNTNDDIIWSASLGKGISVLSIAPDDSAYVGTMNYSLYKSLDFRGSNSYKKC